MKATDIKMAKKHDPLACQYLSSIFAKCQKTRTDLMITAYPDRAY